jgi:uncharacterized membrane protein
MRATSHFAISNPKMRSIISLKQILCFLLLATAAFAAPTYTITTLQYPGAAGTYPLSINKAGVIAGYYFDSSYSGHGFTYANGSYTQIEADGRCYSTFVTGINNAGVLSGYCFANAGGTLNFQDNNGTFTYFGLPGIFDSYNQKINNSNVSVGWYITNSNTIASFTATNGKLTHEFVASSAYNATAAFGINGKGAIVGNGILNNQGTQQGFIDINNSFKFYQYPGGYDTFFNGVNDGLLVVGDANTVARGPVTAFVFQNRVFTNLAVPNATASVAYAVNNHGTIVGYYVTGSGNIALNASGFIAAP